MKLVIILLIVAGLFTLFSVYFGLFKSVKISIREQGGETIVYKTISGNYRQSGTVMDEVYYSLLNEHGVETFKGFGIFYDNPKTTETDKLRSEAGCIVEADDLPALQTAEINFEIRQIPVQKYVTAEFPYRGKMSVLFSLLKVYPALQKFTEKNDLPQDTQIMEIYDIPNKRILYRKWMNI